MNPAPTYSFVKIRTEAVLLCQVLFHSLLPAADELRKRKKFLCTPLHTRLSAPLGVSWNSDVAHRAASLAVGLCRIDHVGVGLQASSMHRQHFLAPRGCTRNVVCGTDPSLAHTASADSKWYTQGCSATILTPYRLMPDYSRKDAVTRGAACLHAWGLLVAEALGRQPRHGVLKRPRILVALCPRLLTQHSKRMQGHCENECKKWFC